MKCNDSSMWMRLNNCSSKKLYWSTKTFNDQNLVKDSTKRQRGEPQNYTKEITGINGINGIYFFFVLSNALLETR